MVITVVVEDVSGTLTWGAGDTSVGATEGSQTLVPAAPALPEATSTRSGATVSYTLSNRPTWLTFTASTRVLSANANAPAPGYPIFMRLTATDGTETIYQEIIVTIDPATPPLAQLPFRFDLNTFYQPPVDKDVAIGTAPPFQLPAAVDGTGTISYSVSATTTLTGVTGLQGLPPGLSFSATSRRLTGTPTTAGEYSFSYKATDSSTTPQVIEMIVTVVLSLIHI